MITDAAAGFSWGRLVRLFAPHRGRVVAVMVLVLVTAVLGVVNPLLIQRVFDDALFVPDGPDLPLLWTLTAIMLGIALVGGVLGVVQTVATNRLGQDVLRDLRNRVFGHLQSLSLRFFGTARTGDLQSRLSSDVGGVQTAVTVTLSSILSNSVTLVSAIVAMTLLSWPLTLVTLATVPLFVLATRAVGRRREVYTGHTQAATADMMVVTQETLSVSGITLSKLYGRQGAEVGRFQEANSRLAAAATRQQAIGQAFFSVVQTFLGVTPVIVYLVAGLLLNGGTDLTAGTVVAFTTLQNRLFFPVARMLETTVELQSSRAMFRRIFEYLDTTPDIVERPDAVELDPATARGEIRFDHVHFAYHPAEPVLRDVSFAAQPGMLVAFVGPSGAGKSTILNLVARLYATTSTCATSHSPACRPASAWSPKTATCSPTRCATTSRTGPRTQPTPRSRRRHERQRSTTGSSSSPMATTRWSVSAASACRAGNGNGSPSLACCCTTRGCSCSMRLRPRWTRCRSAGSKRPWPRSCPGARRSPSPTGSPRSSRPT
jgi:ATP-binding cassette, subfamily B, bacterial